MSCCDWFLPTCNHKWEVEHFVCFISTKKKDEEKDLYKSIVWPFHSQDLRCHDGRVIPYQCLNLYFHLKPFLFCKPYHFIYHGRLERYLSVHSLHPHPPPSLLLFSICQEEVYMLYKRQFPSMYLVKQINVTVVVLV